MKKCFSLVMVGVVAACLSSGAAFAGHGHGGAHHSHNAQPSHRVVHVVPASHPHHHMRPHHHHHHADAGDFVIATAILISALM